MQDANITITDKARGKHNTIRVHLHFDVPKDKMQMLIDELVKGFERWGKVRCRREE